MKKVIALLSFAVCCFAAQAQNYGNQGIGLRVGEPTGVTYKKYLNRYNAVEFILGTAGPGWGNGYYVNSFDEPNRFYLSHDVRSVLYLQGRFQKHYNIDISGMDGRWDWYWGVGVAMKIATVRYRYTDNVGNTRTETLTDIDLGPEGMGGMEYTFENVPISVFAELSLMFEIVDRPSIRPLSGVGARYRF
jgi:hypothetical protein